MYTPAHYHVCEAYSVVKDQTLRHTSTAPPPSESELDKSPQITDETKKRAALFGGRPFLETGNIYSKTVRSPRVHEY
jgi:hypothetical protein